MKLKSKQDKRNYIIIGLCAILVIMGVGYAAFSSLLTINGTANISNSWCVGFDQTKTNTYTARAGIEGGNTPTGTMTYSGTACETNYVPNASLTANFKQPGDEIEYTLTIKNKSSVTADIKSITVGEDSLTADTTITRGNVQFIIHMPESSTLASNTETTMKVVAKFQNNIDIEGPYTGETQTISVGINVEQDDGNGGMVVTEPKFTGTIYRNNSNLLLNGLTMNGAATIYYPSSEYSSAEEAKNDGLFYASNADCTADGNDSCSSGVITLSAGSYVGDASLLGKTYYLKHDVEDDIITASYVCFVYNNAEQCMKGGDNGESFAANTQIIKDFQTFNSLPDNANSGCSFRSSHSTCYGGGFNQVTANSGGSVAVFGSSSESCTVPDDGPSACHE